MKMPAGLRPRELAALVSSTPLFHPRCPSFFPSFPSFPLSLFPLSSLFPSFFPSFPLSFPSFFPGPFSAASRDDSWEALEQQCRRMEAVGLRIDNIDLTCLDADPTPHSPQSAQSARSARSLALARLSAATADAPANGPDGAPEVGKTREESWRAPTGERKSEWGEAAEGQEAGEGAHVKYAFSLVPTPRAKRDENPQWSDDSVQLQHFEGSDLPRPRAPSLDGGADVAESEGSLDFAAIFPNGTRDRVTLPTDAPPPSAPPALVSAAGSIHKGFLLPHLLHFPLLRLPCLRLPCLHLPRLRLPTLRFPHLRLPHLRHPRSSLPPHQAQACPATCPGRSPQEQFPFGADRESARGATCSLQLSLQQHQARTLTPLRIHCSLSTVSRETPDAAQGLSGPQGKGRSISNRESGYRSMSSDNVLGDWSDIEADAEWVAVGGKQASARETGGLDGGGSPNLSGYGGIRGGAAAREDVRGGSVRGGSVRGQEEGVKSTKSVLKKMLWRFKSGPAAQAADESAKERIEQQEEEEEERQGEQEQEKRGVRTVRVFAVAEC
ncbi:unnamed protein product [Closterium sp. Yama58-4]|nr:unnamed protein product [Closterium sp. Yama58-4]